MAVDIEGSQQLPSPEGGESPRTSDSRMSTLSVRLAEIVILVAACVISFQVQAGLFWVDPPQR